MVRRVFTGRSMLWPRSRVFDPPDPGEAGSLTEWGGWAGPRCEGLDAWTSSRVRRPCSARITHAVRFEVARTRGATMWGGHDAGRLGWQISFNTGRPRLDGCGRFGFVHDHVSDEKPHKVRHSTTVLSSTSWSFRSRLTCTGGGGPEADVGQGSTGTVFSEGRFTVHRRPGGWARGLPAEDFPDY